MKKYSLNFAVLVVALCLFPMKMPAQNLSKADSATMKEMLTNLRNGQYDSNAIATTWASFWKPAFNQTWSSNSGLSLSQLLNRLVNRQERPLHQSLKSGDAEWSGNSDLKLSATGLEVLSVAIFADAPAVNPNAPAEFPALLASRQDEMPVTVGDVLTCRVVEDALPAAQNHPELPNEQTAAWVRLAQAKNPIYRLIAVRGFGYFTTTSDQAQTFYSAMTGETESAINRVIIQNLSGRSEPWAVTLLTQVKAKLPAATH